MSEQIWIVSESQYELTGEWSDSYNEKVDVDVAWFLSEEEAKDFASRFQQETHVRVERIGSPVAIPDNKNLRAWTMWTREYASGEKWLLVETAPVPTESNEKILWAETYEQAVEKAEKATGLTIEPA